jgi:serine protease Do
MTHRIALSSALAGLVLVSNVVAQTTAPAGESPFPPATPANVVDVTSRVFPAVVRIDVAQEVFENGKRTLQRGIGSGVIIDSEGRILTNYHVAGRAAEIKVTLFNKERVNAKLLGDDHWTDLAVIQLDMDEMRQKNISFNYAVLGTSKTLVTGQDVIAIGTPFGLSRTMTLGIVSNTERTFYPEQSSIDEYETGWFSNWIQMDTPIAPGNSGGPLVDLEGKIVGINTRGIQGQSLNFAIPIDAAKEVVEHILKTAVDGKKGRVVRADLGIDFKPLQELESFYEIEINRGALISSVDRGSPAAKAGVKVQDILLSINGEPINVRFPEEIAVVRARVSRLDLSKEVTLSIKRGNESLELKMTPERLQSAVGDEREVKPWGLSVRQITRRLAVERQLDDTQGVVVTSVSPNFPGDRAQLEPFDVIRKINGKPVEDLETFMQMFEEVKGAPQLLLEIKRGRGVRTAVLKM